MWKGCPRAVGQNLVDRAKQQGEEQPRNSEIRPGQDQCAHRQTVQIARETCQADAHDERNHKQKLGSHLICLVVARLKGRPRGCSSHAHERTGRLDPHVIDQKPVQIIFELHARNPSCPYSAERVKKPETGVGIAKSFRPYVGDAVTICIGARHSRLPGQIDAHAVWPDRPGLSPIRTTTTSACSALPIASPIATRP